MVEVVTVAAIEAVCWLQSTDSEERLEVTRLLAKMFSPRDSRLASENKSLWLCFLGRSVTDY